MAISCMRFPGAHRTRRVACAAARHWPETCNRAGHHPRHNSSTGRGRRIEERVDRAAVDGPLVAALLQFAALRGTIRYDALRSGRVVYRAFKFHNVSVA
jgi:hypothetical protein